MLLIIEFHLNYMPRFKHHFMRIFAVLLATVLIVNTVYAGGMMVSANFIQSQHVDKHTDEHSNAHSHAYQHSDTSVTLQAHAQHHQHKTAHTNDDVHTPTSHNNCKQCNHCLACFSILMPAVLKIAASANQPVLAMSITSLYLSPTTPLLQRPPIA